MTLWVPMGSWMERGMRAQAAVWKTQPAPSVTGGDEGGGR